MTIIKCTGCEATYEAGALLLLELSYKPQPFKGYCAAVAKRVDQLVIENNDLH